MTMTMERTNSTSNGTLPVWTKRAGATFARWREADRFTRGQMERNLAPAEAAALDQFERNLKAVGEPKTWFVNLDNCGSPLRPSEAIVRRLLGGLQVQEAAIPDLLRACRLEGRGPLGGALALEEAIRKAVGRRMGAGEAPRNYPEIPESSPEPAGDVPTPAAESVNVPMEAPKTGTSEPEPVAGKLTKRAQIEQWMAEAGIRPEQSVPWQTQKEWAERLGIKTVLLSGHLSYIRRCRGIAPSSPTVKPIPPAAVVNEPVITKREISAAPPVVHPLASTRPKLTALLPTERPAACKNLNWERAYRVAAILDRLGVDLRYYVGEPVTAQIAHELDMTISSVSQYTSAVRRACGIECLGRRPEGGAVEVAPAPVEILPDDNAAPKATAGSRVLEVGAKAEMCGRGHWFLTDLQGPQCPLCELYDLGALLNPKPTDLRNTLKEPGHEWHGKTLPGRVEWLREEHYVAANTAAELRGDLKGANARIAALNADYDASKEQHRQALDSLKSEMLFHKTQCEAAVKRAKAAEERLEQTTTQWGKLTADHAALEGRCAALQARDTPQPVAVPEVQLRLPEALPALTDDLRDEAAQLLFVGGEFSTGWKELAWAQKATVLQLAADMATLAAGR